MFYGAWSMVVKCHYYGITWAPRCTKSSEGRLFVEQLCWIVCLTRHARPSKHISLPTQIAWFSMLYERITWSSGFVKPSCRTGCWTIPIRQKNTVSLRNSICKLRKSSQSGSSMNQLGIIHHGIAVTLYTRVACVQWSNSSYNGGKQSAINATVYGI